MPLTQLTSQRIYELVGEYETKQVWFDDDGEMGSPLGWHLVSYEWAKRQSGFRVVPAPDFGELIRILPKIGEKLKWDGPSASIYRDDIGMLYQNGTEEEAMEAVDKYLQGLIK